MGGVEVSTKSELQRQAFRQVIGEMWHEFQKIDGEHKRIALEMSMPFGSAVIRATCSYKSKRGEWKRIEGPVIQFAEIPDILETTMVFREIQDMRRKHLMSE